MRDIHVQLRFHHCKAVQEANVGCVLTLLAREGFIFLENRDGRMQRIEDDVNLPELIKRHTIELSRGERTFLVRAFPADMQDFANSDLEIRFKGREDVRVTVSGLIDLEFVNQQAFAEPFAQLLQKTGWALYPILGAEIGLLDNSNRLELDVAALKRRELSAIGWINFWGKEYVSRYGEDFLMSMPGHRRELLSDGAIVHQLWPTFVEGDGTQAKGIRDSVLAYCAERGLRVKCRAPYTV